MSARWLAAQCGWRPSAALYRLRIAERSGFVVRVSAGRGTKWAALPVIPLYDRDPAHVAEVGVDPAEAAA